MKISRILNEVSKILQLSESTLHKSITLKTVEDYRHVKKFVQKVVSELLDYEIISDNAKFGSVRLAGYLDMLRRPAIRNYIKHEVTGTGGDYDTADLVKGDRSEAEPFRQMKLSREDEFQKRMHGFGPGDRTLPVNTKDLEILVVVAEALEDFDAYDIANTRITNENFLSEISSVLQFHKGNLINLASDREFNDTVERLLGERNTEIASVDDVPDDIKTARLLDLNAFLYLLMVQDVRGGRQSYNDYLNPNSIQIVKNSFAGMQLDPENAVKALNQVGFTEKRSNGYYYPNWQAIKQFQNELLSELEPLLDLIENTGMRVPSDRETTIKDGSSEQVYAKTKQILNRSVPATFLAKAKRMTFDALKRNVNRKTEKNKQIRAIVANYLNNKDNLQDLPMQRDMDIHIQQLVEKVAYKEVIRLIFKLSGRASQVKFLPSSLHMSLNDDLGAALRRIGASLKKGT